MNLSLSKLRSYAISMLMEQLAASSFIIAELLMQPTTMRCVRRPPGTS